MDTMFASKLRGVGPVRNHTLIPLPFECWRAVRPAIGNPIGNRIGWRSARATREANYSRHLQRTGKLDRLTKLLCESSCFCRIRMECIAMASDRHDGNVVIGKFLFPFPDLCRGRQ